MKRTHAAKLYISLLLILMLLVLAGCGPSNNTNGAPADPAPENNAAPAENTAEPASSEEGPTGETAIYAHVNGAILQIRPENNSSAVAFIELLRNGDVTVEMHDYGSFEKVGPLGTMLPRNDAEITTGPGDVILYQGDQITIYYDVNSWNFTRLGKVQNVSRDELKSILGSGDVTVRFSLTETGAVSKSIVVYFSRTGHTKPIAEFIREELSADIFEITAEIPYTDDDIKYYTDCRADREQKDPAARPGIAGDLPDLSEYDTVYLGYPIWHGQAPKIIYTFLESVDLSGKTVVPFCTSASSPVGTSAENLHPLSPDADWKAGTRFAIGTAREEIVEWLKK